MLMLCQHLKNLGLQEVKHLQCSTGSTSQATLSSVGMCLSCYVYAHHQYSTQQGFQDFLLYCGSTIKMVQDFPAILNTACQM